MGVRPPGTRALSTPHALLLPCLSLFPPVSVPLLLLPHLSVYTSPWWSGAAQTSLPPQGRAPPPTHPKKCWALAAFGLYISCESKQTLAYTAITHFNNFYLSNYTMKTGGMMSSSFLNHSHRLKQRISYKPNKRLFNEFSILTYLRVRSIFTTAGRICWHISYTGNQDEPFASWWPKSTWLWKSKGPDNVVC